MHYMGGRIYMHNQSSSILQKKASRLIYFKERNTHIDSLFFNSKMVKLPDKIKIENCLSNSKYVNNKLPPIFNNCFTFTSTSHNYKTSFTNNMVKDQYLIKIFSPNKLKIFLFDFYLNLYQI